MDYYSRFSPDGKRIGVRAFAKAWVSERNEIPWDAYVLDLASGQETLAAEKRQLSPVGRGRAHKLHAQGPAMLKDLTSGNETLLYDAASPPVQGVPQTPELSPDGRLLAFTARGKERGTMVYDLAAKVLRTIAGGCEITWFPDSRRVLCVENGGHGGNHILTSPWSR